MDRPFGCGKAPKFVLKRFDNRCSGEQAAVVRKRREPNQYPFVLERRNSIADCLGSLRSPPAQRTESPHASCSRQRGRVPGHLQDIHQRFWERRCLSPQGCDCQISLFSCRQCYKNCHFNSMPWTTVHTSLSCGAEGCAGQAREAKVARLITSCEKRSISSICGLNCSSSKSTPARSSSPMRSAICCGVPTRPERSPRFDTE
jgi:hypothetical protein